MNEPRILRGMLLTGEVDQLVVQASQADIQRFGHANRPVVLNDAPDEIGTFDWLADRYLYNQFGQRVAVVTNVSINVEKYDVTAFGSQSHQFVQGRARAAISAEALKLPGDL